MEQMTQVLVHCRLGNWMVRQSKERGSLWDLQATFWDFDALTLIPASTGTDRRDRDVVVRPNILKRDADCLKWSFSGGEGRTVTEDVSALYQPADPGQP